MTTKTICHRCIAGDHASCEGLWADDHPHCDCAECDGAPEPPVGYRIVCDNPAVEDYDDHRLFQSWLYANRMVEEIESGGGCPGPHHIKEVKK